MNFLINLFFEYRHFTIALAGAVIIGLNTWGGFNLGDDVAQNIVTTIVAIITALGIRQVNNVSRDG